MTTQIAQLTDELKTHLKTAAEVSAAAEGDGRDFTPEERSRISELMGKAKDARSRLDQAKADRQLRASVAELGDGVSLDTPAPGKVAPPLAGYERPAGSLGQAYVASPEYKALLDSVPGGHFSRDHRVQARPVGFTSLLPGTKTARRRSGSKELVTGESDTSAGPLVPTDDRGLLVGMEAHQRPLTLRDVVTPGSTTSDAIEYVRITGTTNQAAPVPEATGTDNGSGRKPESGFATTTISTHVRTIAHWIPITRRALSDAAQVRTLIDGFLSYGLEEELEDQMVTGDGTGENLEGLAHVSGVQHQPFTTDADDNSGDHAEDLNLLRTLRRAKTLVRRVGRALPNAYVLNPIDRERVDLAVDDRHQFYFGGPQAAGVAQPLWGLPVVECEAVPPGTGYVGDWRRAILWDREQATITTTDSHADFFVRNLIAILAEMRAAFGILQPNAFVEIDLGA